MRIEAISPYPVQDIGCLNTDTSLLTKDQRYVISKKVSYIHHAILFHSLNEYRTQQLRNKRCMEVPD